MRFSHVAIIGVGLLGGSIGLALKAAGSTATIIGYSRRRETLEKALQYGVLDRWAMDIQEAVADADLVILCTPVGLFGDLLEQMRPALTSGTVITDVGSTKRTVVSAATRILPDTCSFVGSHPMAGSEKRGVEYARADLFRGATCIVTPTATSQAPDVRAVEQMWEMIQMNVVRLSPEEHDAAVSDISHLPHVLAAALVSMQSRSAMPLAGKGFLDTTRIASGDTAMWRDILVDNRDNVKASLDRLQRELSTLRRLLAPSKSEALAQWLASAAGRRDALVLAKMQEMPGE